MDTFTRWVGSFHRVRKNGNKSNQYATYRRSKSLEDHKGFSSTIFEEQSTKIKEEGTLNFHKNFGTEEMARPGAHTEEIDMLLLQNRFRSKLQFERNFLREYSRHQVSVSNYPTTGYRQVQTAKDMQAAVHQSVIKKEYSSPQFGSECVKGVYPPSYWLMCTYRLATEKQCLNVVIRQTGTVPELPFSKLSAALYIDQGNESHSIILAKSQEDKSFRSHEISFRMQNIVDLTDKSLYIKVYMHTNLLVKTCIGKWNIQLTDCSEKDKVVCKRFLSDMRE